MKFNILTNIILLNLVILPMTIAGCSKDDSVIPPNDSIPEIPGYTLVWNDEFSGTMIDLTKWDYEVNGDGGGNNELQYYTSRPSNSYIESGSLIIQALKENYLGKEYTSARIRTLNKGDWTYGRFEFRAKLPYWKRFMACNMDATIRLGIRRLAYKWRDRYNGIVRSGTI